MDYDYALFRAINNLAGHWPWLDGLMRLLVNEYFVPTTMALALVIMWFWGRDEKERTHYHRTVILAALSLITANIVLKGINLLYFRPRPFDAHQVNLLFYKPWDSSFPSNPATTGFSIAVAVALQDPIWGIPFLILAVLFGFSRIFCGVHYPSDVLAGALLGTFTAWLYARYSYKLDEPIAFIRRWLKKLCLA
jgi:undecaprenyl-diphosphatase